MYVQTYPYKQIQTTTYQDTPQSNHQGAADSCSCIFKHACFITEIIGSVLPCQPPPLHSFHCPNSRSISAWLPQLDWTSLAPPAIPAQLFVLGLDSCHQVWRAWFLATGFVWYLVYQMPLMMGDPLFNKRRTSRASWAVAAYYSTPYGKSHYR